MEGTTNFKLRAVMVADEIDINSIADRYGIRRRYTWEEPLVLRSSLYSALPEGSIVYIFAFGAVVFGNYPEEAIDIMLHEITPDFIRRPVDKIVENFVEEAVVEIVDGAELSVSDDSIVIPVGNEAMLELAATVLAKSVGMDKVEFLLTSIEGNVEDMLDNLEAGKIRINDRELAASTSKILKFEFASISYIMILDRPDAAWHDSTAGAFYDALSDFYELNDRYEIIRQKTEILSRIKEGFADISHTRRGMLLEWAIVLLIVAEVVIMLIELFK